MPEAAVAGVREMMKAKSPGRCLGRQAEVGHTAVFLMTNPYVTGTVLDVTGCEQRVDRAF